MRAPSVGIIVPCYNQSRFASECVSSIEAQTWANLRTVVIDDASTEPAAANLDLLRSDRVSVVHLRRNLGRALVRNEGVRLLGNVDYVLNVDCDDAITPDYVEKLITRMENDPSLGLAYGTLRFVSDGCATNAATWPPHEFVFERRYEENVIPGAGTLFRRRALVETDGWRAAFTKCGSEDYDMWLQVVEAGWGAAWVSDAIYLYRQHDASFLHQASEREQVLARLALFRLHRKAIRTAIGLEAFLRPQVMPALYTALRSLHVRRASQLLLTLLRHAPMTTVKLAFRHYTRERA